MTGVTLEETKIGAKLMLTVNGVTQPCEILTRRVALGVAYLTVRDADANLHSVSAKVETEGSEIATWGGKQVDVAAALAIARLRLNGHRVDRIGIDEQLTLLSSALLQLEGA